MPLRDRHSRAKCQGVWRPISNRRFDAEHTVYLVSRELWSRSVSGSRTHACPAKPGQAWHTKTLKTPFGGEIPSANIRGHTLVRWTSSPSSPRTGDEREAPPTFASTRNPAVSARRFACVNLAVQTRLDRRSPPARCRNHWIRVVAPAPERIGVLRIRRGLFGMTESALGMEWGAMLAPLWGQACGPRAGGPFSIRECRDRTLTLFFGDYGVALPR
jgi:hypothetical protein